MKLKVKTVVGLLVATAMCVLSAGADSYAKKEADVIHVIVDNHQEVGESVEEERQKNMYEANVAELYSVNNTIYECRYKPLANEVPLLEATVLRRGYVTAYSGFFDLNHEDAWTPATGDLQRYYTVLGPDIELCRESYDFATKKYEHTDISAVTEDIAIMGIYKALGKYQYNITYSISYADLSQSPAIKDLPSFISKVSGSRADVFVTRSVVSDYAQKASRDLKMSPSSKPITAGQFIVLCRDLMHYYGEPVMSEREMAAVLQAYGGIVPRFLSDNEKDAYLYLAARGCLNVEMDYSKQIAPRDMYDILMCIADKDSRSDYKKIQLTMDVNDTLQAKGYYPKQLKLADNERAIEISATRDYGSTSIDDYLIEVSSNTTFKSKDGKDMMALAFLPSRPGDTKSTGLAGFEYRGQVKADDGKMYYHFRIDRELIPSEYYNLTDGHEESTSVRTYWFQINTPDDSDIPANIWFQRGGGIYTYKSINAANEVTLKRTPFKDGKDLDMVDEERREKANNRLRFSESFRDPFSGFLAKATGWLTGDEIVAKADVNPFNALAMTVTIKNANQIINPSLQQIMNSPHVANASYVDTNNGTLTFTTDYYSYVISLIVTEQDDPAALNNVPAICDFSGDGVLISFKDLADMGVLYYNNGGTIPRPVTNSVNEEMLILDSLYGRIILNNMQHTIVVGSVMYEITSGDPLWAYNADELYIDFRCVYGWSENQCSLEITGDQNDVAVNVVRIDQSQTYKETLDTRAIKVPDVFGGRKSLGYGLILADDALGLQASPDKHWSYLTTSNYALGNWLLVQGASGDVLIIYYLKDAFTSRGLVPPDDAQLVIDTLGICPTAGDDWCVRMVSLSKVVDNTPGHFSFFYPYGYVYNVPKDGEFTYEQYLNGNVYLPLVQSTTRLSDHIYNMNVNYFTGYPYGNAPKTVSKGSEGSAEYVDVWGNDAGSLSQVQSQVEIKATPAGIQAMYGGYDVEGVTTSTGGGESVLNSAVNSEAYIKKNVDIAGTQIYLGTMRMDVESTSNAKSFKGKFYVNNLLANAVEVTLSADRIYYNIAAWKDISVNADGSVAVAADAQKVYRYVTYGSCSVKTENSNKIETHKDDTSTSINIQNIVAMEKEDDKYKDFEGFKMRELLDKLDNSSSWLIIFCLRVLPYVGIILLTILFGISCMCNNRIVQSFFAKTIDPVKFITAGKMDITTLNRRKAFIGIMVGYIAFAMILDGNFLRLLIWLSSGFSAVAQLLRQL